MGYVLFGLLVALLLVLRHVARRAPPPPRFAPPPVIAAQAQPPAPWTASVPHWQPPPDYMDLQLEDVSRPDVSFSTSRVMNSGEWRVYRAALNVTRQPGGFYAFPQVALGQVIHTDSDDAYRAINSKRCDLLVTDRYGKPVAVVEYQGSGHNLGGAAAKRDRIKRIALEKAGVQFVEIPDGTPTYRIESAIRDALPSKAPQRVSHESHAVH